MIQRIGRVALPPWSPFVVAGAVFALLGSISIISKPPSKPYISVAFIGNSMLYYNDMPRFMEALSDDHIAQNSCLHGNANFKSIVVMGNGMLHIWDSGSARVNEFNGSIHDYGACTVAQLLFGQDADLDERMAAQGSSRSQKSSGDDFFSYSDRSNPCLESPYYYEYLESLYAENGAPHFDYVVMNDNTRSAARNESRLQSLQALEEIYVPWFLETGAIPVLIFTYGYWTPYRDMTGLGSVPEFTSLTYEGYKEYAALLQSYLPETQRPRISPIGLAFLIVYEEDYYLWARLFHVDQIHCSPLGTYLQGCVLHHTLFGAMPNISTAVRGDMFTLWMRARRFQPGDHRRSPFPTTEEAAYLYHVATRVTVYGEMPRTLVQYKHSEASNYDPVDDLYRVDDLF